MWTASVEKRRSGEMEEKSIIKRKLKKVKDAVIEVLSESRSGLSLAQMPLHLKRRLNFPLDLNELGFVKLKDLL